MPSESGSTPLVRERRSTWRLNVGSGNDVVQYHATLYPSWSRSGGENPRWRAQIRAHQQAGTGFTAHSQSYKGGYGSFYYWYHQKLNGVPTIRWQKTDGVLMNPSFALLPTATGLADNAARAGFYKRARSAQTAFRGLTALGELRETLGMIRNPARSLRRGLDTYVKSVTKRTRRVKKRQTLDKIVGDTWLEYSFGWSPLINDVYEAGKALNQRLERYQGNYAKVSAKGTEEVATHSIWSSVLQTNLARWQYTQRTVSVISVRYKGEVRSVCPTPLAADLQLFGLNWREVVPTAWELVPWSFLVDYFVSVGDLLDAWTLRESDIAWVVRTQRRNAVRQSTQYRSYVDWASSGYDPSLSFGHTFTCSPFVLKHKDVQRSLPGSVALPKLQWRIPGFGRKWANMASLGNARRSFRLLHFG